MKEANLISLISAYKQLSPELFQSYLEYHSINIKKSELQDLDILINHIKSFSDKTPSILDKFFVGYIIPQIGKEFDLLRIGEECVLNIELKKKSTPEKIKQQLIRNKYYLSFLNKEIFSFTYVSEEEKLYTIDENEDLIEADIEALVEILSAQEVEKVKDIDSHFNPSNYLVSPFNSTEEFANGQYFLTNQQEEIKNNVLKAFKAPNHSILSIKGKAGTGKTLLTYDIAKEYQSMRKRTLIIHCGYLNEGHATLRDEYNWDIIPAKFIYKTDLSHYNLIIVDEAQRIYPNQLEHIIGIVKNTSGNCVFSYDGNQCLSKKEINWNIERRIENELTSKPNELTTKIRTNKEIASFINGLFNKNRVIDKQNYSNIEINYFVNHQEAIDFIMLQKTNNWKVINYTPSTVDTLPYENHRIDVEYDNAHTVIGQEFDKVVAVIDDYFCYRDDALVARTYKNISYYYHPAKMLYQIVTRTRMKLSIVIINNPEVLERCLGIVKPT